MRNHPTATMLRQHYGRAENIVRSKGWEKVLSNTVFWRWHGCCTDELIETLVT